MIHTYEIYYNIYCEYENMSTFYDVFLIDVSENVLFMCFDVSYVSLLIDDILPSHLFSHLIFKMFFVIHKMIEKVVTELSTFFCHMLI